MRSLPAVLVASVLLGCSALQAQTVIPLLNESSLGRLGISVQLGTNPNPFSYLLDTGSSGFLTAVGSTPYWDNTISGGTTGDAFSISYGSGGLHYTGDVAHTKVTFTDVNNNTHVVNDVRMGVITNAPYPDWGTDIDTLPVPIPPEPPGANLFFGTMGAGLFATAGDNGSFSSILSQIPLTPGLSKGFIIHTGGSTSTSATLQVGLTDADISSFSILIPMNASTGVHTNDNGTTVNLYPEAQATASYTIDKDLHHYSTTAGIILDTGGAGTHVTSGTDIDPPAALVNESEGRIVDGADFTTEIASATNPITGLPSDNWQWIISPTGDIEFVNQIQVVDGSSEGSLNTGIALFYTYDVMFDTEHGVIGLRPTAVPEPSTWALIFAGLFMTCAFRALSKKRPL
jgi:hypothetical protein